MALLFVGKRSGGMDKCVPVAHEDSLLDCHTDTCKRSDKCGERRSMGSREMHVSVGPAKHHPPALRRRCIGRAASPAEHGQTREDGYLSRAITGATSSLETHHPDHASFLPPSHINHLLPCHLPLSSLRLSHLNLTLVYSPSLPTDHVLILLPSPPAPDSWSLTSHPATHTSA